MGLEMSRLKITLMIVNTMFVMCEAQCPANKIENPLKQIDRIHLSELVTISPCWTQVKHGVMVILWFHPRG